MFINLPLLFIIDVDGLLFALHVRAQASLPGFKILPLRQFGTWGSVITDEFDPQKDTYVLVSGYSFGGLSIPSLIGPLVFSFSSYI